MKLIDKDALVAKIEKCYNECLKRAKITDPDYWNAKADAYRNVLTILDDTLEVKEVDLEKEVRQIIDLYIEAGKHYDDVIKKERNMYGYSDLAIKLLDRTADAKEMSIQYVLDKIRAQKGEEV